MNNKTVKKTYLVIFLLFISCIPLRTLAATFKRPKLVLVLVIDQFRADYLMKYESKFLPAKTANGVGGFRYLMEQGAYFTSAEYQIMQSITCPGHAVILSGSHPYQNGIPLNYWYDRTTKQLTYCSSDEKYPIVMSYPLAKGEKPLPGQAPTNFNGSTVGDELKNVTPASKVVTLSLKDRASIMMGGKRADLAIWFDSHIKQWISSEYYLKDKTLPKYVSDMNAEILKHTKDKVVWENKKKTFKKEEEFGSHYDMASPHAVDMLEAAAEKTLDQMKLGQNLQATDLFAISLSMHDYAGHQYGPDSDELEDMTINEDAAIAKFLTYVNKKIPGGLSNVTIAFTADHGIVSAPSKSLEKRQDAGTIDPDEVKKKINVALDEKFGGGENWVDKIFANNIYLNSSLISDKKIDQSKIEDEAKKALEKMKGVAFVFSSTDYKNRTLPPNIHEMQILHTYSPKRNGDLVIIPKPFFLPGKEEKDDTKQSTNHITGYAYDRTVPLIFAGFGVKKGIYRQNVAVNDLAPTLSSILGIMPTALNEGRVLHECLK